MKTHAADQCRVDAKKWSKKLGPLETVHQFLNRVKQKKTKSVAKDDDDVDDSDDDQS